MEICHVYFAFCIAKCYCMVYKTYLTDTRADEAMIRIVATRNVNVLYDHSPGKKDTFHGCNRIC